MPELEALARVARTSFDDYSPRLVVDAVNALQALGRAAALEHVAAIADDVPPPPDATGLLWVLRVLFEVPTPPGHPPVALGEPDVPLPPRPEALPRFPIVLAGDVPFLTVRGYTLAGLPEGIEPHLDFYRSADAAIRAAPLAPASGPAAEDDFMRQWQAAYGSGSAPPVDDLLALQLDRLRTGA
jgi:hypothetical protein